jgi:hypothetical protein
MLMAEVSAAIEKDGVLNGLFMFRVPFRRTDE